MVLALHRRIEGSNTNKASDTLKRQPRGLASTLRMRTAITAISPWQWQPWMMRVHVGLFSSQFITLFIVYTSVSKR